MEGPDLGKERPGIAWLVREMEDLFGDRVELITTESLSPYIGPHILAEATDVVRAS